MVYCNHNLSASSIVLEEVVLQEVKVFLSITMFFGSFTPSNREVSVNSGL